MKNLPSLIFVITFLIGCQAEPDVITNNEQKHQQYPKEFHEKHNPKNLGVKERQWRKNNPQYFDTPEHYQAYRKEKGRQHKINLDILEQILDIAYKNYQKGQLRSKEVIIIHDSLFTLHGLDANLVFKDPEYFKKKMEE